MFTSQPIQSIVFVTLIISICTIEYLDAATKSFSSSSYLSLNTDDATVAEGEQHSIDDEFVNDINEHTTKCPFQEEDYLYDRNIQWGISQPFKAVAISSPILMLMGSSHKSIEDHHHHHQDHDKDHDECSDDNTDYPGTEYELIANRYDVDVHKGEREAANKKKEKNNWWSWTNKVSHHPKTNKWASKESSVKNDIEKTTRLEWRNSFGKQQIQPQLAKGVTHLPHTSTINDAGRQMVTEIIITDKRLEDEHKLSELDKNQNTMLHLQEPIVVQIVDDEKLFAQKIDSSSINLLSLNDTHNDLDKGWDLPSSILVNNNNNNNTSVPIHVPPILSGFVSPANHHRERLHQNESSSSLSAKLDENNNILTTNQDKSDLISTVTRSVELQPVNDDDNNKLEEFNRQEENNNNSSGAAANAATATATAEDPLLSRLRWRSSSSAVEQQSAVDKREWASTKSTNPILLGFGQVKRIEDPPFDASDDDDDSKINVQFKLSCQFGQNGSMDTLEVPLMETMTISDVEWFKFIKPSSDQDKLLQRDPTAFDCSQVATQDNNNNQQCNLVKVETDNYVTIHPRPKVQNYPIGSTAPEYSLTIHQLDDQHHLGTIYRCSAMRQFENEEKSQIVYRIIRLQ